MTAYTHEYQYATGNSSRTRSSGCTWVAGATGVDAATGGRVDPAPDAVLAKVKPAEETSPGTPGWSLADLALAMSRLGVGFEIRSGRGWDAVRQARADRLYVVLQGDSDRFPDGCSGAFDGDHAIGIAPDDRGGEWVIDDPICSTTTSEPESTLRAYAEKLSPGVLFGVFTDPMEGAMPSLYSTGGKQRLFPAGTPVYDAPGGKQVGTVKSGATVYRLAAQDALEDEAVRWYLIDGGGDEKRMGWVKA